MNDADISDLKIAKKLLEKKSFAITLSNLFGDTTFKMVKCLPKSYRRFIAKSTLLAIERSWDYTMATMDAPDKQRDPVMSHKIMATISGAVGGVGIWTLVVELPITTVIMLQSVADIARCEGENYREPETKIACLEVFALGGQELDKKTGQVGYYAIRESLKKPIKESSKYIAKKGLAGIGSPFIAQLLAKIAAYYQTVVAAKVAASIVPVAGAVVGAGVNILFIDLFQEKARGHFMVRRLERKYGIDEVRDMYNQL